MENIVRNYTSSQIYGSHEPQPYGLPCYSIWVRQLLRS